MKRVRRGGGPFRQRKAGASRNSTELLSPRFLRSRKRKLAEAGINNAAPRNRKRSRKSDPFSDSSDCVIVDEIVTTGVGDARNNLVTSTPIQNSCLKNVKFNQSSIKTNGNVNCENELNEVIVISDNSTSILPSIVVCDDDKSDNEIQIIPSTSGKENNQMSIGKNSFGDNAVRKLCALHNRSGVKRNLSKVKKKKGRRKMSHNSLKNKNSLSNTGTNNFQAGVGRNIFIASPASVAKTGLRPVIIDGSNVAFHHSNNKFFSCKGLEICIKYFKIRGHEVIAFVPQYRVKIDKSDNPKLLDQLVKEGDVVLTPSRIIDGQPVVSYDDRFIVQTAVVKGGIIVTRDNYRDLLAENPAWAETIKYRLLQFTWVKDILMFPNDPLGARGPTLEEFLKFS